MPSKLQYRFNLFPLKKSTGQDLITAKVARKLPKKAIINLNYMFNFIFRFSHFL